MHDITLSLSPAHADAVRRALDVYIRLGLGQLEVVGHLVRDEVIPTCGDHTQHRRAATVEACDRVDALLREAKHVLGFRSAASLSIHHPHVPASGTAAYAALQQLDPLIAAARSAPSSAAEQRA